MKIMKKGFTLIELMIVVAIIAIIAAIAIPNLLAAKMSANETSAIGSLNAVKNAQTLFAERDIDGDGVANYWVANMIGLYAVANQGGGPIKLIQDPATAASDISAALAIADVTAFTVNGTVAYPDVTYAASVNVHTTVATAAAKQGYYLQSLLLTADASNANNIAGVTDPANQHNFLAVPNGYNRDGVRTFIVNQAGVVYQLDAGVGAPSGVPAGDIPTAWPAEDPTTMGKNDLVPAAGAPSWRVAK